MLTMPLYDEDGNEIPEEELPWNNMTDEHISGDDSGDWSADEELEEFLLPSKPDKRRRDAKNVRSSAELRKRIAQSVREEALRRLELSARTISEFQELVDWYDREEESRMRRERRYETLRGDVPLESGAIPGGHILPHSMSQPTFRQICRGEFDDYLNTCLFTLDLYRRGLACFEGNAPTYHLSLQEYPVIVWDYHSLMLAVKFLFSVKLTNAKNPMKMCEHCRMAFYAQRADSRFCSAECRNKASRKP